MSTTRNSVMLIGRPGADPEVKNFNNNSKKARFNLAVNESHKNADGEWVNDTQWFSIVAWNKVAEKVESRVKKGKQVAVDGSLHNVEWTDDKGQRHSNVEIWIDDFFVIDANPDEKK